MRYRCVERMCNRSSAGASVPRRTVEWTCRAARIGPPGRPLLFPLLCLHSITAHSKLIVRSSAPKKTKDKRSPFHHHLIVRPPRPAAHYDRPVSKIADRFAWDPSTISRYSPPAESRQPPHAGISPRPGGSAGHPWPFTFPLERRAEGGQDLGTRRARRPRRAGCRAVLCIAIQRGDI